MASTTDVCKTVFDKVDDCLAVGVVDLGSGMLMGVYHNVPHFTQAYLDAVAAAAVDMFRGKTVRRVEELLASARGKEVKDSFEEIFISSPFVYHFMSIIKTKGAVVVMVTKKSTNQGMGWAALRTNLGAIANSLP
ncbi:MAG: hypothetical protein R2729_18210 [Bryobacteraceae bacterium]